MPLTVEIANYLWVKTQNESLIGRRHNLISNLLWICVVPGGSIQGRNSSTLPYSFLGTFPLNKTGIVKLFLRELSKWDPDLILVVYQLQKVLRKPGWKVNGTGLFGSFQRKISGSNGTSGKLFMFFRTECSKRKFVFHFFKDIFDTSFRPSPSFFGKWNWFVLMVNAFQERTYWPLILRTFSPNRWSTGFAM